ncbi:MAG: hypothetical protein U0174_03590 [Polyangiaceae bacterium]
MKHLLGLLTSTLVFSAQDAVAAEPHVEQVPLRYEVAKGCPDRSAFIDDVKKRTSIVSIDESNGAPSEASVRIVADQTGFTGTLRLQGSEPRLVHAADCKDVVSVLAFVLAFAYDPDAKEPSPESAPSVPAAAPASASSVAAPPPPSEAPSRTAPSPTRARARWSVGGHLESTSLAGPAFGARVFAALRFPRPGFVGAAFRASVGRGLPSVVTAESGGAEALLTFTDLELEGCALQVPGALAELRLCGLLRGGWVEAEGRFAQSNSTVSPWIAAGISAPFRIGPWPWLQFEARPVLERILLLDRFYVEPDTTVFTAPTLHIRVGLGAIVHFP